MHAARSIDFLHNFRDANTNALTYVDQLVSERASIAGSRLPPISSLTDCHLQAEISNRKCKVLEIRLDNLHTVRQGLHFSASQQSTA